MSPYFAYYILNPVIPLRCFIIIFTTTSTVIFPKSSELFLEPNGTIFFFFASVQHKPEHAATRCQLHDLLSSMNLNMLKRCLKSLWHPTPYHPQFHAPFLPNGNNFKNVSLKINTCSFIIVCMDSSQYTLSCSFSPINKRKIVRTYHKTTTQITHTKFFLEPKGTIFFVWLLFS